MEAPLCKKVLYIYFFFRFDIGLDKIRVSVISYGATVNKDHVLPLSGSVNADAVSMAIQAQTGDNTGNNRLFAYYKGGNFNIHIWAWFGYFIC